MGVTKSTVVLGWAVTVLLAEIVLFVMVDNEALLSVASVVNIGTIALVMRYR